MNWARAREAVVFLVIFVAGVLAALLIGWVLTQVQAVRNPRGTPPQIHNYLADGPDGSWTIGLIGFDPFAVTAPGLVEWTGEQSDQPYAAPCPAFSFPGSSALQCVSSVADR